MWWAEKSCYARYTILKNRDTFGGFLSVSTPFALSKRMFSISNMLQAQKMGHDYPWIELPWPMSLCATLKAFKPGKSLFLIVILLYLYPSIQSPYDAGSASIQNSIQVLSTLST